MKKFSAICLLVCLMFSLGCSTCQVSPDVDMVTVETMTADVTTATETAEVDTEKEFERQNPVFIILAVIAAAGVESGFWYLMLCVL